MAITYKKPLMTIKVFIHGIDSPVEVADTVTEAKASAAYAEFEKGFKMHLKTAEGETVVPYHAVVKVEKSIAPSEDITKADPYCEEEQSEPIEP